MGYNTYYQLEIINKPYSKNKVGHDEFEKRVAEISGYERYGPFDKHCKWYDWSKDMKTASKEFPNAIFVLEGDGEEPNDHWKHAFYNGKVIWKWKLENRNVKVPQEVLSSLGFGKAPPPPEPEPEENTLQFMGSLLQEFCKEVEE